MIAHCFPLSAALLTSSLCRVGGGVGAREVCGFRLLDRFSAERGTDGPVCVRLHAPLGRKGARLRASFVSCRARPRWVRRTVLLPGPGPASAGCRWQRATGGDRDADRGLSALFGSARAVWAFALWDERDVEDRRRGPRGPHRCAQDSCGDHRHGDLRGPGPQVSNLGAHPLSRGTRGGHREGPRVQAGTGQPDGGGAGETARSAGMMTSSDSNAVAGGLARHIPVLVRRAVGWLEVRSGGLYVDATFGAGGFSRAILATPGARVIGIDRDQSAVAEGADLVREAAGRLELIEDRFSNLQSVVESSGAAAVDGVVFDVGVS